MIEIILATLGKNYIFSAITYETILRFDIGVQAQYAGIITVINYTFIECKFWVGIYRRLINY